LRSIAEHIHFVGIGGVGMSGLARILLGFGVPVSGSDVVESPTVLELRELGADVKIGHAAENLPAAADLLVYSSVINAENPEYAEAAKRGVRIIPRAELLALMMAECRGIAVAGAHGKTTTTGMLGTVFMHCEQDPTIIIGGFLPGIGANARWGSGEFMIAEADESDGSFLLLPPEIVVVTNVENDHLDFYGTMDKLISAFDQFIHQIPPHGLAILDVDSPIVADFVRSGRRPYVTYGIDNTDALYRAVDIKYVGMGTVSKIYRGTDYLGELKLNVPGKYNLSNALGTIATAHTLGLDAKEIIAGLEKFTGTGRRFELLGKNRAGDIEVYDDYAHHPTEIAAVLAASKELNYKRIIGVFQPHRFTRTALLHEEFVRCFDDTDVLILNEIYSAFEAPIDGIGSRMLIPGIKARGKDVRYAATDQDVIEQLLEIIEPGDLVLIMGAGNIRRTGEEFAKRLASR